MTSLRVSNAVSGYGKTTVLRGVSLHVDAAEIVGLFGPNGHGKTTLLRTISGLVSLRGGSITYDGVEVGRASARSIVERGIIHVPQGNTLFPEMTVWDTLRLGAFPRRARPNERETLASVFDLFPRLHERRKQRCGTLSGGERQMLSIAVGLMANPTILLLDEPTLGLAPLIKEELGHAIASISHGTAAILLVDQDLQFLQRLTRRLYLLNHGEIEQEFGADDHLDRENVLQMYFKKGATTP